MAELREFVVAPGPCAAAVVGEEVVLAEPGGEITAWRDDLSKHRAYRARGLVGELLPHVSIEDEHVFARLLRGRRGRFAESQLEHAVRSEDHLVRIAAARHCLARSVLRVVEELERPGDGLRAEVRGEAIGGIEIGRASCRERV